MLLVSHPLHALLAALAGTLVLVGTGVWLTGTPEPQQREPAPYRGTALADYDTSVVAIARAPFCERIDPEALAAALDGGEVTAERDWTDGDTLDRVGVVHEFGCRRRAEDGAEVRAWVLAPPVTGERAGRLARAARQERNCRRRADAPSYGDPSVALLCTGASRNFASYRGLFGDAWLSCTLALPGDVARRELLDRAGRWCVAVAEAARR